MFDFFLRILESDDEGETSERCQFYANVYGEGACVSVSFAEWIQ